MMAYEPGERAAASCLAAIDGSGGSAANISCGTSGSSYCIGRVRPCSSRFRNAISRCVEVIGIVTPSHVVYLQRRTALGEASQGTCNGPARSE